MPRRVKLPGASELFRSTHGVPQVPDPHEPAQPTRRTSDPGPDGSDDSDGAHGAHGSRLRPSGRVRHDEKITVYVSSEELLALEQARLQLRAQHRLGVDRGRIVRAAIAAALADLERRGPESDLVRRLGET